LVGQVVDPPDPAEDVVVTGLIPEDTKWGLLRGARAHVAPSPHESFSITVLEAMTAGAPVIVNARCGATREHVEHSGAGLWFGDFGEFEAVVERLTTDDTLHATMARHAARYAEANYRWPVILDRYGAFLEAFAEGNARGFTQGNGSP
jgi:glycosyltransferase involved in cell wall biosynthesis